MPPHSTPFDLTTPITFFSNKDYVKRKTYHGWIPSENSGGFGGLELSYFFFQCLDFLIHVNINTSDIVLSTPVKHYNREHN